MDAIPPNEAQRDKIVKLEAR